MARISIRPATSGDARPLTELALRSKGHWGYSKSFLEACRDELSVTPQKIGDGRYTYFVAEADDCIAGFYALEDLADGSFELEALFVEPDSMGSGVGKTLMQHAVRQVAGCGGRSILIQGDPNAREFYMAAGASEVGVRESGSIPGRALPVFRIDVST